MNDDRYLMHYGVKGMKWGVRKDKPRRSVVGTAFKITHPVTYSLAKKTAKVTRDVARKAVNEKRKWDAGKPARIEKKRQKALSVRTGAKYTYRQRKLLSDDELRSRINRLNMERQLRDLSRTSHGNYGDTSLAPIMNSGRSAANKALGAYGAKMIVASTLGPDAAAFVKPKK